MFRKYMRPVWYRRGVTILHRRELCRNRVVFWVCGRSLVCSKGVIRALLVGAHLFSIFTGRVR
jgi:hypothetical protein